MKKTVLFIAIISLLLLSSCRDSEIIVVDDSVATVKVTNVGDVVIRLYIDTADSSEEDTLRAGSNGVYELRWNDRGSLKVIMTAKELDTGDTQTEIFYLVDGDFETWEVGWIYDGAGRSSRKIMKRTGRTNSKQLVK